MRRILYLFLTTLLISIPSGKCSAQQTRQPRSNASDASSAHPLTLTVRFFPFRIGERRTYEIKGEEEVGSGAEARTEPLKGHYSEIVVAIRMINPEDELVELKRSGESDAYAVCPPRNTAHRTAQIWYVLSPHSVTSLCSRQEVIDFEAKLGRTFSADSALEDADYVLPFKVGNTWGADPDAPKREDTFYEWVVDDQAPVSVPAGRFRNCYELIFRTLPDHEERWVCGGVGLVADEFTHNGTVEHYRIELQSVIPAPASGLKGRPAPPSPSTSLIPTRQ